jgi:peptidoglycan hydrolase-like protein with peptidoglycan-binding domain
MFQKANHLAPDGIVGAQTRAAIKAQLTVQASIAAIQAAFGSMREFEKRIEALAG